jgi:starch synthase
LIRVLAVASEIFPLVKTGGLADVVGALPLALARLGERAAAPAAGTGAVPIVAGLSAPAAGAGARLGPRDLDPGKPADGGPAPDTTSGAHVVNERTGSTRERAGVGRFETADGFPPEDHPTGVQVTTMVPGYPAIQDALRDAVPVHRFADLFGGPATVLRGTAAGLALLVVDAPHLYARAGNPYLSPAGAEWPDNGLRFAGLGAAAAALGAGTVPALAFDIVHAHDWQGAMAVVYLHFHDGPRPGTVLTVHNLAFQGRYRGNLFPRLGLPPAAFSLGGLEYHGDVSFLKGGLSYADRVTTVSPTYAREITGIENGMGLDGLLRYRSDVLSGIMNGIDDVVWNPTTDPLIPARFGRGKPSRRAGNKQVLQQRMGIDENPDALLVGVISRLTSQKGLDMLLDQLDHLVAVGMQLALLGSGEPALEQAFSAAAEWHMGSVGCVLGYDEELAHLIEAGSDALLVPSRFEPCGLTQLYALRYGAIPVVSRVGGLADSVIDANQAALAAGVATGIQFWPPTTEALGLALDRLNALWRDRPAWERMQRNGMAADVSWRGPASRYVALYQAILAEKS